MSLYSIEKLTCNITATGYCCQINYEVMIVFYSHTMLSSRHWYVMVFFVDSISVVRSTSEKKLYQN